ncbi:MAG: hypothetical protein GY711_09685 [bacterium]|nr:hypothetical protein [bacterium]
MARASWLDEETNNPIIDKKVQELESFTAALADGAVDKDELAAQEARLVAAMKEVEAILDDAQHDKVTNLLVELSAYDIMRTLHELQAERMRQVFG